MRIRPADAGNVLVKGLRLSGPLRPPQIITSSLDLSLMVINRTHHLFDIQAGLHRVARVVLDVGRAGPRHLEMGV
jgi:hypothetical protein